MIGLNGFLDCSCKYSSSFSVTVSKSYSSLGISSFDWVEGLSLVISGTVGTVRTVVGGMLADCVDSSLAAVNDWLVTGVLDSLDLLPSVPVWLDIALVPSRTPCSHVILHGRLVFFRTDNQPMSCGWMSICHNIAIISPLWWSSSPNTCVGSKTPLTFVVLLVCYYWYYLPGWLKHSWWLISYRASLSYRHICNMSVLITFLNIIVTTYKDIESQLSVLELW